jgi:hypothetical protein
VKKELDRLKDAIEETSDFETYLSHQMSQILQVKDRKAVIIPQTVQTLITIKIIDTS